MAWTAPRTWVAGETVTAALMNTHVRDNLKAIGDPWTAYTPTWTAATTNPELGDGTLTGYYLQAGKLVVLSIVLTMGSTTTYGAGAYRFSLPTTASRPGVGAFAGRLFDSSASVHNMAGGFVQTASLADLQVLHPTGSCTATAPWTWASGDIIELAGSYEAA